MAKEQAETGGSAPKPAVPGLDGTFYMAYPIFSMCSDEHGLVLTGGGGGGKEYGVLDYIQAHVYDETTESFTTVSSIETGTKVCYDLTYCPATDRFAAALTSECLLLRFDPASLSLTCEARFTAELSNPGQTVCNVLRYSPSGAELLTGGDDGVVRVWNLASSTSTPRLALDDHHKEIVDAEWAPSGDRFVTCGRDRSVKLWSGEGACTDTIIPEKVKAVSPLAKFARFVNDTCLIVATHGPRGPSWLTIYDVGSDGKTKEVRKSQISKAVICSMAVSQDRSQAVLGFVDSTRMIISLAPTSMLFKNTAVVHEMPPGKAAFLLDKHVVCTSSADYSVNIWNIKKPARSHSLGCCWWLIFLLSLMALLYYGYLYAVEKGHLGGSGRLDEL
ncbi:hypothetical protein FOZ61_003281 [Perkinsus olseni]|uniref:Guanine nucleotide-binding protein subunit beta-like protein n=1 Tax=Perkinsus olseni TaxID=32597 RepID=A0A7J6MIP0_PEROL|nr:hypothetical protein FOL46_005262 [Perkinsus olseni]KAF4671344.1 hypothetical protein FOZ61_003281 [Perkinsus olseni]